MSDDTSEDLGSEMKELAKVAPDMQIAPAEGVAAIALSMAMKYGDMNMVKEGALYQQYKLEGRNIAPIHLDFVLETAERLERWLLGAPERMARIIIESDAAEEAEGLDEVEEQGIGVIADEPPPHR